MENKPADLLYVLHLVASRIMRTAILYTLFAAFTAACTAIAQDLKDAAHGVNDKDWQQQAVRKYPDLGVDGSEINKLFVQRYRTLRSIDPNYFTVPDWPVRLADECARDLRFPVSQPISGGHVATDEPRAQKSKPLRDGVQANSPSGSPNDKATAPSKPSTPLLPSFRSISEFLNATTGQFITLSVVCLVVLICAYGYFRGWRSDPAYSLAACFVSLLAGGAGFAIDGWRVAWPAFIIPHLYYHFSLRCGQCGAHRWRVNRVSSEAVGEETLTWEPPQRRERVHEHYDSRGRRVGSTKEHEVVPRTKTIYRTTWECKRCNHRWTTTN